MEQQQLFYYPINETRKEPKKPASNKGYYWVQTRLLRESGPWYSEPLKSPDHVVALMKEHLDIENCDREHFVVIYVDRKNGVNAIETISVGGISSAPAHPREVFKAAIMASAVSIILVHNHPSGDPSPSSEDIELTKRMVEAGKIIGIEVMDHIIIGVGRYVSLKGKGYI